MKRVGYSYHLLMLGVNFENEDLVSFSNEPDKSIFSLIYKEPKAFWDLSTFLNNETEPRAL